MKDLKKELFLVTMKSNPLLVAAMVIAALLFIADVWWAASNANSLPGAARAGVLVIVEAVAVLAILLAYESLQEKRNKLLEHIPDDVECPNCNDAVALKMGVCQVCGRATKPG